MQQLLPYRIIILLSGQMGVKEQVGHFFFYFLQSFQFDLIETDISKATIEKKRPKMPLYSAIYWAHHRIN